MTLNCVDLFCGLGGLTAGILAAGRRLGLKLNLTAVNHWTTAINSHSLNHPTVRHICEPVENLIPARVVPSRRLHLLAAACECTFHSNARGGGPCNEQSRSQAWQIVRWATDIHVEEILMENVREFVDWGPLHRVTHRPIKKRKGEFFNAFVSALRNLGYTVEWRLQCAADYGDPTSRRRLILRARCNNQPILWPTPSHCDPALLVTHHVSRIKRLLPWRTARECIDWSLKGESVFNRKRPLCANTLARIEAGLRKFGGANAEPFLIILRGTSAGQVNGSARSLDEPLPTLTAGGGHSCLVEPEFMLPPEGFYRGNTAKSLDAPLPTITATRGRAFQLVKGTLKPFVIGQQSCAAPRGVDQPLPTVATAGAIRLVEPFITPNFSERKGQKPRVHSVDQPLPAVTGHGAGMLVEPFITNAAHQGSNGSRVHSLKKPLPTVTGAHRGDLRLVQPFIYAANHGTDKKKRGTVERRVKSLGEPLPTLTTQKSFALCEPVIVQTDQTGSNGHCSRPLTKPLGTIVSKQNMLLVQPMIAKYYGAGVSCDRIDNPLPTVTTKDRFMLVEFTAPVAPVCDRRTKGKRRRSQSAATSSGRIIGELDILTRMLQPHELCKAHSLDNYILTGTKEDQTTQIGNSVPKQLGQAHAYVTLKNFKR